MIAGRRAPQRNCLDTQNNDICYNGGITAEIDILPLSLLVLVNAVSAPER